MIAVPAASAGAPSGAGPQFRAGYLGYGTGTETFRLSPRASRSPGETHAALLLEVPARGDLDFTAAVTTVRQLRTGSRPRPWEAGWVLWHYADDRHFYYLVLKPDGWELGKEDPAYPGGQRYLVTRAHPAFPIGKTYRVRVAQAGARITAYVNGTRLARVTDRQHPYLHGHVGLYAEDAAVTFTLALSERLR